jgi:glycerol-3-phosphate dehydrogenase (NAD(P)+)
MNLTVLGAGAWGSAIALALQRQPGHQVRLWRRGDDLGAALDHLGASDPSGSGPAAPPADLLLVATPMSALREMLQASQRGLAGRAVPLVWLCKGFEAETGCLGHEVAAACGLPAGQVGVLSGPSFAAEVAQGLPTALVAASSAPWVQQALVAALHGGALRVYRSDDVVGVEVGGALKNVMAVAAGIADGLRLGHNARAALVTRGLAEMARLGVALGGRADTFMGLSGLGDLVLTATGDLSRNRQVGLRLAAGEPLPEVLSRLGHVAEGVLCARTALARGQALGLELPITQAVVAVLDGSASPPQALNALLSREAKAESP